MSFDARSKERLEALGRTLPQKLPLPGSTALPSGGSPPRPAEGSRRKPLATAWKGKRIPPNSSGC